MKRKSESGDDKHSEEQHRSNKWRRISNNLSTSVRMYDKPFPYFREPVEVGSFSQSGERQFRHDRSQLRMFSPPANPRNCSFDLRDGYKDMIRRDESVKEYLDGLLQWIVESKHKFFLHQPTHKDDGTDGEDSSRNHEHLFQSLNTDFVCWRGLLTRLLCIPYENREDFMMAVIRFRGTYFMCEFDTEAKKRQKEQTTPRQDQMCSWGWKFEQYVTADKASGIPDTSSPVNVNSAFCSIARSRLGSHSMVFGAEVDCEDVNCKKGNSYIELKTSRQIDSQRQHENFCKFKLIKWWAQSFLIGIPKVVCGFRDDHGVVHELQDFPVQDMPKMVDSCVRDSWKPAVCFNFLNSFLGFIKSNITEDKENHVYVFRWRPGSDVTCERRVDDPEFQFLPDWFLKWEAWDKPYTL